MVIEIKQTWIIHIINQELIRDDMGKYLAKRQEKFKTHGGDVGSSKYTVLHASV